MSATPTCGLPKTRSTSSAQRRYAQNARSVANACPRHSNAKSHGVFGEAKSSSAARSSPASARAGGHARTPRTARQPRKRCRALPCVTARPPKLCSGRKSPSVALLEHSFGELRRFVGEAGNQFRRKGFGRYVRVELAGDRHVGGDHPQRNRQLG